MNCRRRRQKDLKDLSTLSATHPQARQLGRTTPGHFSSFTCCQSTTPPPDDDPRDKGRGRDEWRVRFHPRCALRCRRSQFARLFSSYKSPQISRLSVGDIGLRRLLPVFVYSGDVVICL